MRARLQRLIVNLPASRRAAALQQQTQEFRAMHQRIEQPGLFCDFFLDGVRAR